MLAQSVVAGFGGKARFVSENYGASDLARRFGVTRYPAIFVDDILVATPNDFGFYGKGDAQEGGRYAPLKSAVAHERFRADLTRMIEAVLTGRPAEARAVVSPAPETGAAAYPEVTITDLDGKTLTRTDLLGRPVLVEIWATWCPPCRGTLGWLGGLASRYGDRLAIVTLAIESPEADVRKVAADLRGPVAWAMGTPEVVRLFGDVGAVPTLLLFDREGRGAGAFFGAPPELHAEVGQRVEALLAR